MTLKSLANHFNIDRIKKYGSVHQPLPSKFKLPNTTNNTNNTNNNHNNNNSLHKKNPQRPLAAAPIVNNSTGPSGSVPSCRSAKIRPQLNPNARKMPPKTKRCKASVLLDQIPVCKLQKTLIKYGCCHNMMQNVISLDYFEYSNDDCC